MAEFEDTALLIAFSDDALGFFAVPSVINHEIGKRFSVKPIGSTVDCKEEFYAISVERKIKHPAVLAIKETRASLFG